jgi:hypothetical protein
MVLEAAVVCAARACLRTGWVPSFLACRETRLVRGFGPLADTLRALSRTQSSPLLGYTITGLPVTCRATAMAAGTSAGAQQFTPLPRPV